MEISKLYSFFSSCGGVISTDSRRAEGLFFALRGDNFDANDFALAALESGARYAIVDKAQVAVDERFILVDDVLNTLQKLAIFHREQLTIPIVALTGSNGKTTTKELVVSVLQSKFKVGYTKGNFNNHIGVPLTLLSFGDDLDIGVVEMGANHQGEISLLTTLAKPTIGLITNIGRAHLEGFGSPEGIKKGKGELFDYLLANHGTALYNTEDEVISSMVTDRKGLENKGYGEHFKNISLTDGLLCFDFNNKFFKTHLTGLYNIHNIAAAMAVGTYFGIDERVALEAICKYEPTNNRSQIIETERNTIYMDAYNANGSSMAVALDNFFANKTVRQKVLILGDMLELGDYALSEHQAVVEKAEQQGFMEVYLVGQNFSQTNTHFLKFSTTNELSSYLELHKIADKIILIKGSRGIALEQLTASL